MASEKGYHEVVEILCLNNANVHAIDKVHEYKYNRENIVLRTLNSAATVITARSIYCKSSVYRHVLAHERESSHIYKIKVLIVLKSLLCVQNIMTEYMILIILITLLFHTFVNYITIGHDIN